jgi:hypothetical protein
MLPPKPGPIRASGTTLLLLLALVAAVAVSAQEDPTPATAGGPIELYLVAAYGPGLVRPTTGPTLVAKALSGKRISCQLDNAGGVKARSTGVSVRSTVAASLAPSATSPAVVAAAAAAAAASTTAATTGACKGGELQGGKYNLVASYIPGATFAKWNCYAMTPGSAAAATAAETPLVSTQVVELPGGSSYTCIATYSKAASTAVSAAAAIDWDAAVESATASAAAVRQGACAAPAYRLPQRATWAKAIAPLTISGNQLMSGGQPFNIRGINW